MGRIQLGTADTHSLKAPGNLLQNPVLGHEHQQILKIRQSLFCEPNGVKLKINNNDNRKMCTCVGIKQLLPLSSMDQAQNRSENAKH
jgi:hypothetical protein